jgi:O-antigen/teichoic acid export membrane protein
MTGDARSSAVPAVGSASRNLLAGTVTRYGVLLVHVALGLLLLPFTLRHLGAADYGLWMLIASMTAYFQLLDLGFGAGIVRHVADADARRDVAAVNRVLSTFVVVYAGIGVAAALGIAAVCLWIVPRFPNLSADDVRKGQWLLAIMGARIALGFPMSVYGAVTTARQRFASNNVVAIGATLVQGALTYLVLSAGYGLVPLVAATTAASIGAYVFYRINARRAFPALDIRPSRFHGSLVRDVTAFSVYLFVIDVAVQISLNLDNLVVASALGTAAVAVYAIAFRLAEMQRQLCNQFNGLLFPVVVRMDAHGDAAALHRMLVDGTRIVLTLVVGVTICLIGFAAPLVRVWVGPGFEGSVAPLYVLAIVGVVIVAQGPLGSVLLATGRHRLVAFTALTEAAVNLTLSLILVRRYGLVGVAIGTAVPIVVGNLAVMLPAACRRVGLGVEAFIRAVATPAFIGSVPAVAVCVTLRQTLAADSLLSVVVQGAIVGLTYFLTVYGLGLPLEVREQYIGYLRAAIGRVAIAHSPAAAPRAGA